MNIEGSFVWTYFQCVHKWVESDKTLSAFVRNIVQEIKNGEDIVFGHVSTKKNPADMATRGAGILKLRDTSTLMVCTRWLVKHLTHS